MYHAIYYDRNEEQIHLWDDELGYKKFPFQSYAYVPSPNGEFKTIDGQTVTKTDSWNETAEQLNLVFEHNVPPTTRTLVDLYTESDDIAKNRVMFMDIEVRKNEKYSTVEDADNEIFAIQYSMKGDDQYYMLMLDEQSTPYERDMKVKVPTGTDAEIYCDVKLITFDEERKLLRYFYNAYSELKPTILTGWNLDFYDMPYMYNRTIKVLGYDYVNLLSPIKKVRRSFMGQSNRMTIKIAGVSIIDYLMLYRKFTYSEESSYKLDSISKKELGRGKVEYEGNLDQLFRDDPETFVAYGIIDVELPKSMDEKLDYMDIALGICHKGHVPYEDIVFTSRYLEGALLTYLKKQNLVASSNISQSQGKAQGAFVKEPTPGLYRWVYDLDLTSLYPFNIISLNISPETKYGKILNWDEDEYAKGADKSYTLDLFENESPTAFFAEMDGSSETQSRLQGSDDVLKLLTDKNLSIASNGVMYELDKPGLIPSVLSMWFAERKEYKNLKKKYGHEKNEEKERYYDKKQLVTKILLNSLYGVLLLPSFRFYDKDNGEATTLTGQSVIGWATKMANRFYNKELGTDNVNYCIYTDTDSIFEPIEPLFEHRYGPMSDYTQEEIIEKSRPIINDVQNYINRSYDVYAKKLHNVIDHGWDIKQELIAKRALWVAKKRYAQWIVDQEGVAKDEMDVKGLDSVRSDFPDLFKSFVEEILEDILNDATKDDLNEKVRNFKGSLYEHPLQQVLIPVGVKDLDKWYTGVLGEYKSGTPIHYKSALNYNILMERMGITSIPPIAAGDKIMWAYMKPNPYKFPTFAIARESNPPEMIEFMEKYADRNAIFDNRLENKIQNYWDALNLGQIEFNALINKFFQF